MVTSITDNGTDTGSGTGTVLLAIFFIGGRVAGITGTGTVTSSGRGTVLVAILCIESLSLWLAVAMVPGITDTGTYIPVQVTVLNGTKKVEEIEEKPYL